MLKRHILHLKISIYTVVKSEKLEKLDKIQIKFEFQNQGVRISVR